MPLSLAPPGAVCALHEYHSPEVAHADLDMHHPVPVSWSERAGVLVILPPMPVCPTGHRRVHRALDTIIRAGGPPNVPPDVRESFGDNTWALAVEGYERGVAAGLVPKPTL